MDINNSYFVDSTNEAELARLIVQDALVNKYMDLLPQYFKPTRGAHIVDLACGPGMWAIAVAKQYPLVSVTGLDINKLMVSWAKAQMQKLKNVDFCIEDVLQPLAFPNASIDFVNARFLMGLMRTDRWQPLIKECFRITKPEGIIRMTETVLTSNSGDILHRMSALARTALWRGSISFYPADYGITPQLGLFLSQEGYQVIEEKPYLFNFSYGAELHEPLIQQFTAFVHLIKPFMQKYLSEEEAREYEKLSEEGLREMKKPDYRGHWYIASIIGKKPV
jgi:ubiquinone/menaquinone biosynthesis C-methylase UbiE